MTEAFNSEKVEEQFSCYRLQIPTRWYIRCIKEDLVEKLNNQTTKGRVTPEGSELTFQKKSEEVTPVRLLWVPPSLQLAAIGRLAEAVFGPEVTVTRDLSRIDFSMSIRDDIPYYIPYKKVNEYGKQEEALIMVSLKGRQKRCYHCHSTEHWPNQCSNRMSQRT